MSSVGGCQDNKNSFLPQPRNISYDITSVVFVLSNQFFPHFLQWQYRAGAGARIKKNVEPELEPKLNNFGSATLFSSRLASIINTKA